MNLIPITATDLPTERLLLRVVRETDAAAFARLRSDPEVSRYIKRREVITEAVTLAWLKKNIQSIIEGKSCQWAIESLVSGELIGNICLWNFSEDKKTAEVGYEMFTSFQGKGYMREALQRVIEFSRDELQLKNIEAFTHKDNLASRRLLQQSGFIFQPERKDEEVPHNVIYVFETGS